jgi:hypothetical protein
VPATPQRGSGEAAEHPLHLHRLPLAPAARRRDATLVEPRCDGSQRSCACRLQLGDRAGIVGRPGVSTLLYRLLPQPASVLADRQSARAAKLDAAGRAGYSLLKLLRDGGSTVPFFIFAGSDTPEYRREAAKRGGQLSTNDMLELVDHVVKYLG